ncbi:hypothetical protein EUX98_g6020 [Antrodiella citrinella]|uniref:F-box domain-containing protein n=1 Tax=Antrodiella citrinella TaxID=2447956 RepID=A0A4S4MQ08_9APHY|nr:hypothetical protein EUX98_g6020 [Antrodiella citrinella]
MATDASDVLLIPTEVCETILDFIADTSRHTLLSCALVSRVWLPRCRFHLCGVVILRSHEALLSFSLLLSSSPQYATLLHTLSLCAKGSRKADSWVASVPLMLPPLPNLSQFKIHDFEIPYQHPTFFKVYSNFTLATPHSKLKLVNVSYDSFHLIALLADAVHASELELDSRSLLPYTSDGIVAHAISASNTWLTTVTIRIRSWMEMKQMDWDWILACSKLTFCALDADIDFERGGAISPFSPENADVWSGVCRVVLSMSARPNHAAQVEIRVWTSVHVVISVGSQGASQVLFKF